MSDAVTAAVDVVDPVSSVVSDNAGLGTLSPQGVAALLLQQSDGRQRLRDHGVPDAAPLTQPPAPHAVLCRR